MNWFLEFAPDVMQRRGIFLPRGEVLKRTGFRSVYCLAENDALLLRKNKTSKGINQFAVYTDELIMDFDEGVDANFKKAEKWLVKKDVSFTVFESGSKGLHIEAVCVPKYGKTLPQSQEKFVREIMCVQCDPSIYRHGSLYRLPGTLHKKTGKPKKIISSHIGDSIIDYEELSEFEVLDFSNTPGYDDNVGVLERLLSKYARSPQRGRRYQSLWSLTKAMHDVGWSASTALELLTMINRSWGVDAKEETELLRAIKECYRDVPYGSRSS